MKDLTYHFGNGNDKDVVFGFPSHVHFGDQITFINVVKNLNLPSYQINPTNDHGRELCSYFFQACQITDLPATHHFHSPPDTMTDSYNCIYHKIDGEWKTNTKRYISYSFDAQFNTKEKIPPYLDELLLECSSLFPQYEVVKLGKHIGLKNTIKYLSESAVAVTIDNGIAHLVRCTSIPHIIIEHEWSLERGFPRSCYSSYHKCKSQESVIEIIRSIQH